MASGMNIALIGIGGYGSIYVSALLDANEADQGFHFLAAADPTPALCDRLEELQGRQVAIYGSLDALYVEHRPDLVVIASPFHLHCSQTIQALSNGSHVLCEKPMCVTVEQAREMSRAADRARRHVAIGYQWSFSPAIQRLKADIASGLFGEARQLKTMVLWPRDETYYGRNRWAGRSRDPQGRPIFDSPVANACAHYLHNMLYVLGEAADRSAVPARVTAELYRAHAIENYDTGALRCWTDRGAEIQFFVSHATKQSRGPQFVYEFERATVTYAEQGGSEIVAHLADGTRRTYGSPWAASDVGKLWSTLDAIRAGRPPLCGIAAAVAQTQVTAAAQQSVRQVTPFPAGLVRTAGEPGSRKTWVADLDDQLERCFDAGKLPSELGLDWAVAGAEVEVVPWEQLVAPAALAS